MKVDHRWLMAFGMLLMSIVGIASLISLLTGQSGPQGANMGFAMIWSALLALFCAQVAKNQVDKMTALEERLKKLEKTAPIEQITAQLN
jgi:hypothetical protein